MREIKFRAWDELKKEWHHDFQFIKSGNEGNDWIVFVSDKQRIQDADPSSTLPHPLENPYFQQQLKIMQFTGLFDKNGKEIYEGDICRFDITELPGFDCLFCDIVGEALFDYQDAGYFFSTKTQFPHVKPWFAKNIEIIGNIHENPELLEGN